MDSDAHERLQPQVLFDQLTQDQILLLQTTWDAFSTEDTWPVFDHLAAVAEAHGFDAAAALGSLPQVLPPYYGLIWHGVHGEPQQDTEILLTVAGMMLVDGSEWLLGAYFRLLEEVAQRWRSLPSNPRKPRKMELTYIDLVNLLGPGPVESRIVSAILKMMIHEPATWSGVSGEDPDTWRWRVAASISRFAGVSSVADYLVRAEKMLPVSSVRRRPDVVTPAGDSPPQDDLDERISIAWQSNDWDQVVRQALVYLEHRLRELVPDSSQAPSSSTLVTAALHPKKGNFPLARTRPSESEGWYLLVRGFFQAIRNPVGHRLDTIQTEREASTVVGVVRLVLDRLEADYPAEFTQGDEDA